MRCSWFPWYVVVWGSISLLIGAGCNLADPLAGAESSERRADGSSPGTADAGADASGRSDDSSSEGSDTAVREGEDTSTPADAEDDDATGPADTNDCASTESCNGVDDDCDGAVDEGCSCTPGATQDCYTGPAETSGVGRCRVGTSTCQSDGTWGPCNGEVTPQAEQCDDGIDNDCDGTTDLQDDDCIKSVGASCSADAECPGPCVTTGESTVGQCAHRLFVTSQTFRGGFGGLQSADARCNAMASSAKLGGTWQAVLSNNRTHARSRTQIRAPVVNLAGASLADDASDLWDGSLTQSVGYDEHGSPADGAVWTGTKANGRAVGSQNFCGKNWNSNAPVKRGATGHSGSATGWIDGVSVESCMSSLPIYCVDGQ